MTIEIEPVRVVVTNGAPFELKTTVNNGTPGKLTLWYGLPAGNCDFVTPEGPSKVVSHDGVLAGAPIPVTLRIVSTSVPTGTKLTVTAQDSVNQVDAVKIVVQIT